MSRNTQTSIFEYSDYREFLADYYAQKKAVNSNFSHRLFAQQAGLSSPSHLLMIIKGERNLSHKTIPKFAEGLKLSAREHKFFELLVLYNQAQDLQQKAKYFSEIMSLRSNFTGLNSLEKERFEFLSKWYVVAVYVLIDLKDFKPDPLWISRRLKRAITAQQAKEALETLSRMSMIEGNETTGYKQVNGALTVSDDTRSMAVYQYHQSMNKMAAEALRRCRTEEREFNGATISIPADQLPMFKEKIREFRKQINQMASSLEAPDQVYQLNIQFFPLTDSEES